MRESNERADEKEKNAQYTNPQTASIGIGIGYWGGW